MNNVLRSEHKGRTLFALLLSDSCLYVSGSLGIIPAKGVVAPEIGSGGTCGGKKI